MQDYLSRLVTGFERAHGIHPNLLYINPHHIDQLKASFGDTSLQHIMELLDMELIIDSYTTHPHVCWIEMSQRAAS